MNAPNDRDRQDVPGTGDAKPTPQLSADSAALRAILWCVGAISLALGVAGIFLPLLPTTPFVLLTAACWARASPRLHRRLLAHPRFGPLIDNWERHRSLPRRVKITAIAMLSISIGASIYLVRDKLWLQLILAAIAATVATWMWRLPTREIQTRDNGDQSCNDCSSR